MRDTSTGIQKGLKSLGTSTDGADGTMKIMLFTVASFLILMLIATTVVSCAPAGSTSSSSKRAIIHHIDGDVQEIDVESCHVEISRSEPGGIFLRCWTGTGNESMTIFWGHVRYVEFEMYASDGVNR